MIKFLIQRPIAVLMAFTACFIIGLVTYSTLPISLLPNIAIPEITVHRWRLPIPLPGNWKTRLSNLCGGS